METIMPEIERRIYKKYELRLNDNLLIIERDNDEITFTLFIGISLYKYIKKYKYNEIIDELNLLQYKNIGHLYEYLITTEYKIKTEEKEIIINNNKKIKLNEVRLKNEEIIEILINEINYFKEKNQQQYGKIDELMKKNEEKKNKINILEKITNQLNEKKFMLKKFESITNIEKKKQILTCEVNYIKETYNQLNERIKELIKKNEEKDNKIKILKKNIMN